MDLNTAWTNEMAQALKRLDASSTGTMRFREPRADSSALAPLGTLQPRALNRIDPWTLGERERPNLSAGCMQMPSDHALCNSGTGQLSNRPTFGLPIDLCL